MTTNNITELAAEIKLQADICKQEADQMAELQHELDALLHDLDPDYLVERAKLHLIDALRLCANCMARRVSWAIDFNEFDILDQVGQEHATVTTQIRELEIASANKVLEKHRQMDQDSINQTEGSL